MNKILRLAAILLCSMPAAACGDMGADQADTKPVAPAAEPALVIPTAPTLNKAVLGRWEQRAAFVDQGFGDVTITPDRITFEKIGSAQMIVHPDYVSLKWDDPKTEPFCGDGTKPPAASIESFTYGRDDEDFGVRITFFDKDRPPLADRGTDLSLCMIVNWGKPLLGRELEEYNKAIGKTK